MACITCFFTYLLLRSICGTENSSQQTSLQCLSAINMVFSYEDKIKDTLMFISTQRVLLWTGSLKLKIVGCVWLTTNMRQPTRRWHNKSSHSRHKWSCWDAAQQHLVLTTTMSSFWRNRQSSSMRTLSPRNATVSRPRLELLSCSSSLSPPTDRSFTYFRLSTGL